MFTSDLIKRALQEDIGEGDRTTDSVIPEGLIGHGRILPKQDLLVAGLGVAGAVFSAVDPSLKIEQKVSDGDWVKKGTPVMEVEGNYRSLLKGERAALNFLQRLCGIATLTHTFVDKTRGTKTKILDTRKTTPMMRHLEKYAVKMGGGENHRFGLFDGIMIKNNHLAAVGGNLKEAITKIRKAYPQDTLIVEVRSLEQAEDAKAAGAKRLLLDNMTNDQIAKTLKKIRPGVEVEVSGGVTLERVEELAKLGVDYISVGALTHSPKAADLSFSIQPK